MIALALWLCVAVVVGLTVGRCIRVGAVDEVEA